MSGLMSVSYFLVTLLFSTLLFVLWLRVILRYFRVSTLHPVARLIFEITNPILAPLEKQFYKGKKRLPRYDGVCLGFIVLIEFLKFIVLGLLFYQVIIPKIFLLILVLADLIVQPCNLLFYALLIRVVLSWVNPQWPHHPGGTILIMVTEPLQRLGRKIIPNISGFDFSPFVAMIVLKVITLFISASVPLPLI